MAKQGMKRPARIHEKPHKEHDVVPEIRSDARNSVTKTNSRNEG